MIKGKETEFVAGALHGYRFWRVNYQGQLMAINSTERWTTDYLAKCLFKDYYPRFWSSHRGSPEPSCSCGIYGIYQPYHRELLKLGKDHFAVNFKLRTPPLLAGMCVLGVMAASGRVVMGEWGFRAEKAKILAVAYALPTPPDLDKWMAQHQANQVLRSRGFNVPTTEWVSRARATYALKGLEELLQSNYPEVRVYHDYNALIRDFPPNQDELKKD